MTETYKCKISKHNGDTCVGFCLNQECKHPSQICLQCMKDRHLDHQNYCLGFVEINKWLGNMIQVKRKLNESLTKIQTTFIELIEEARKKQNKQIDKCLFYQEKIQESNFSSLLENIKEIKLFYQNHNNLQTILENDIYIIQKPNDKQQYGYLTKITQIEKLLTNCNEIIISFDDISQIQKNKKTQSPSQCKKIPQAAPLYQVQTNPPNNIWYKNGSEQQQQVLILQKQQQFCYQNYQNQQLQGNILNSQNPCQQQQYQRPS